VLQYKGFIDIFWRNWFAKYAWC